MTNSLMGDIPEDWRSTLDRGASQALLSLDERLAKAPQGSVLPARDLIFEALRTTHLRDVRAVILGQDPYPTPGHAQGLAFSVPDGIRPPPSLRNIHAELHDDLCWPVPTRGSLVPWAERGVLLLNTALTVDIGTRERVPWHDWQIVTNQLLAAVAQGPRPVAFLLWGVQARRWGTNLDRDRHVVIESRHPSPTANIGRPAGWTFGDGVGDWFLGSRPFSRANEGLRARRAPSIEWRLDVDRPMTEGWQTVTP